MNNVLLQNGAFVFYDFCMRKFKIFTTFFVLYEFVMITILQIHSFCIGVFNQNFCEMNHYKYFLFCVMIPVLIGLIFWWIPKRNYDDTQEKTLKEILIDSIPKQYIKRYIIAAIIIGVRRFIMSYPRAKNFIDNVNNFLKKQK